MKGTGAGWPILEEKRGGGREIRWPVLEEKGEEEGDKATGAKIDPRKSCCLHQVTGKKMAGEICVETKRVRRRSLGGCGEGS